MKQAHNRSAIEQKVMERPNQAPIVFRHLQNGESQQRSGVELKSGKPVGMEEGRNIRPGNGAFLPEERDTRCDVLNRFSPRPVE